MRVESLDLFDLDKLDEEERKLELVTYIKAYSTSKAALSALTREMAVEFAALGVRVNAVAPGEIETEMVGEEYEPLINRIPLHRMGTPEEVAACVFRLCTSDFSYVTGTEIFVTGGQHVY